MFDQEMEIVPDNTFGTFEINTMDTESNEEGKKIRDVTNPKERNKGPHKVILRGQERPIAKGTSTDGPEAQATLEWRQTQESHHRCRRREQASQTRSSRRAKQRKPRAYARSRIQLSTRNQASTATTDR